MKLFDAQGSYTNAPYNAETMAALIVDGVVIHNPLRTPDNSAWCTPERYGFELWHTGGGCMAWGLTLPDGTELTITDESGSELPEEDDEFSPMFGHYNNSDGDGDCIALVDDFAELPQNGSV